MKFGVNWCYWQNVWNFSVDDYIKIIGRLADCGFDVLELNADHLYKMSDEEIARLKDEGDNRGIEFSSNSGPAKKYDLASTDENICKAGIEYFHTIFEKMNKIGSKVLAGAIYSYWPTDYEGWDEKENEWYRSIESLKEVGKDAQDHDIVIALEILNRNESYLLNDHIEGLRFIDEIGNKNVQILLDTYHMNIEEDDMVDAILDVGKAERLAHVHVGENNRKLPGMNNSLDWPAIGKALREVNYDKYIVMEPFLLQGGSIGHDCRVFRDMSGGADEERRTELIRNSLKFLKMCCLGV